MVKAKNFVFGTLIEYNMSCTTNCPLKWAWSWSSDPKSQI